MRVMVLVKANEESEAGQMPSQELLAAMQGFNEELIKAGVMLAGEGLKASSEGARVVFAGSQRRVVDGPFAETKELLAGYWLWQVRSMEEAVEWAKRIPFDENAPESAVEIRPVFETGDFSEEMTPEMREREEQMRREVEAKQ